MVGAECADFLREHNRASTIVELLPDIAMDLYLGLREHLLERISSVGKITNAKVKRIFDDGVVYEKDGEEVETRGFDNVILALGSKSYNPLEEELKGIVKEVYVIGDAKKASKAYAATNAAAELASRI